MSIPRYYQMDISKSLDVCMKVIEQRLEQLHNVRATEEVWHQIISFVVVGVEGICNIQSYEFAIKIPLLYNRYLFICLLLASVHFQDLLRFLTVSALACFLHIWHGSVSKYNWLQASVTLKSTRSLGISTWGKSDIRMIHRGSEQLSCFFFSARI